MSKGPEHAVKSPRGVRELAIAKKVAVSDLKRCYRCMRTDFKSNVMRLMIYPRNPLDPHNTEFEVLLLERCTYGDMICSCLLEVVLREIKGDPKKT